MLFVVAFAFVLFRVGGDATKTSRAPISLRPVRSGEPAPIRMGFQHVPSSETLFLFTNHSAKTIVASFSAVEVKSGSNWITQMSPRDPVMFADTNSYRMPGATNAFSPGLTTMLLGPHQAAYATVHFSGGPVAGSPMVGAPVGCGMNYLSGQPTGAVWRLTVSVQEKLTGVADLAKRVKYYPQMSEQLAAAGATNALTAPFSSSASTFGKPVMVTSEEVTARSEDE